MAGKQGGKRLVGAASPVSPRRVQTALHTAKAIQMRVAGKDNQTIAEELGLESSQHVSMLISRGLEKVRDVPAREYRDIMLARLDVAIEAVMPDVMNGDLKAIELLVKIEDRRAKLLQLDGAVKLEDATVTQKRASANDTPEATAGILEIMQRVGAFGDVLPGGGMAFGVPYAEIEDSDIPEAELDPITDEHYGGEVTELENGDVVIQPRRTA